MRDQINDQLKQAMKDKDKVRLATLRLITAAIKDKDIANKGTGKDPVNDSEIIEILSKMVKQRRESIETYKQAGRADLADQEAKEITVIESFLPEQLSEEDVEAHVTKVIEEVGAEGLKDMGRIMGVLKERYAGQMDFGTAGAVAKRILQ